MDRLWVTVVMTIAIKLVDNDTLMTLNLAYQRLRFWIMICDCIRIFFTITNPSNAIAMQPYARPKRTHEAYQNPVSTFAIG